MARKYLLELYFTEEAFKLIQQMMQLQGTKSPFDVIRLALQKHIDSLRAENNINFLLSIDTCCTDITSQRAELVLCGMVNATLSLPAVM